MADAGRAYEFEKACTGLLAGRCACGVLLLSQLPEGHVLDLCRHERRPGPLLLASTRIHIARYRLENLASEFGTKRLVLRPFGRGKGTRTIANSDLSLKCRKTPATGMIPVAKTSALHSPTAFLFAFHLPFDFALARHTVTQPFR